MSRDLQSVPGWQTEELQDEWVDLEPEGDGDEDDHTNSDFEPDVAPSTNNSRAIGTFLVREDVSNNPLLPKMPGRNKKGLIKDFFSPLPLERMFDPPSPHSPSSGTPPEKAGDEIIETDMSNSLHRRKTDTECQFTFSAPRNTGLSPPSSGPFPQAQSTPNPPSALHNVAPSTDPRLRLFQFQYDTYTREHLSAMVDSIAINTPSGTGTTPTPTSFNQRLSRVSEVSDAGATMSHLRSTKRLKLSPCSDFYGEGAGSRATVSRPKLYGKDYVGESRSLMQQIKRARDFSTISTVASAQDGSPSISNGLHDKSQECNLKSQVLQPPGDFSELYSLIPTDKCIRFSISPPTFRYFYAGTGAII
jgi:protein NUD1